MTFLRQPRETVIPQNGVSYGRMVFPKVSSSWIAKKSLWHNACESWLHMGAVQVQEQTEPTTFQRFLCFTSNIKELFRTFFIN